MSIEVDNVCGCILLCVLHGHSTAPYSENFPCEMKKNLLEVPYYLFTLRFLR